MSENIFLKKLNEIQQAIEATKMPKKIMSVDEAACYMGISKSYLYKLLQQRIIEYSKPFGKTVYIERKVLDELMLRNPAPTIESMKNNYLAKQKR